MTAVEFMATKVNYCKETGEFTWKTTGKITASARSNGYPIICDSGYQAYAHRVAAFIVTGIVPEYVDHHNGLVTDLRWVNLTPCSQSYNMLKAVIRKDNKTGIKGISYNPKRMSWEVRYKGRFVAHSTDFFLACCNRRSLEARQLTRKIYE